MKIRRNCITVDQSFVSDYPGDLPRQNSPPVVRLKLPWSTSFGGAKARGKEKKGDANIPNENFTQFSQTSFRSFPRLPSLQFLVYIFFPRIARLSPQPLRNPDKLPSLCPFGNMVALFSRSSGQSLDTDGV